jgi:hypothetical protein
MAMKYFSGDIELINVIHNGESASNPANFSGYPGVPRFTRGEGWTLRVQAERIVEYKSNPSRHDCDARCYNATGRTMKCECACNGKNHGLGRFVCAA